MTLTQAATLYVDCRCSLGEGIIWWAAREALLWTDIDASRLWMHGRGITQSWALPDRLGCMAVCQSGKLLLGLAKGLFITDLDAARGDDHLDVTQLADVEPGVKTRVNDGRADRDGHFVFGTMDLQKKNPIASFYQYSARHGLRRLDLEMVAISNCICFSLDGRTMYFCDSPRHRIMQCDYDPERAAVSHVRTFADVTTGGSPDGAIVDAEGHLWNAEWGSSAVRRYTPDGRIERSVAIPAKNPSCPALGGTDLDELFVTTARENMTDAELDARPDAGGVYTAHPGIRGLADTLIHQL